MAGRPAGRHIPPVIAEITDRHDPARHSGPRSPLVHMGAEIDAKVDSAPLREP
jgi:hypothetical protein